MHFGLNNPISLNDPLGLNANDFDDGSDRKEPDAGATGKKNQRGGEVFDTVDELVGYLYSLAGDGETHFTFKGEGANLRIIRISFLRGGSTNKNQETGIWQVPGFSFSSFDVQVRGTAQKAVQSNEAFAFYSHLNNSNQQWYNGVVSPLMDAVTAVSPIGVLGKGLNLLGKSKQLGRVFWSGKSAVAGKAAENFAKANGMKTLEMTWQGKTLTKLTNITSYKFTAPLWNRASASFAKGAKNPVHVFHNASSGVRLNSVWRRIEYPILKSKNNNIIYHNIFE